MKIISKKILIVLLIGFLFLGVRPLSYGQGFNAGVVAGLNFAELAGQGVGSFLGFNGGFFVGRSLNEKWMVSMELLYSQDGEYLLPDFYPRIDYNKIQLNYIEIPLYISFYPRFNEGKNFRDWELSLGIAYAKLLGHYAEDLQETDISDQIIWGNLSTLLFQGGASYYFNPKFGLNFRATLSTDSSFLTWTLAFRAKYFFAR